ncbi:glutathione peroxidase [Paenibacillus aurantiacus]|uniref:Glutathione peroxidase n=1 Tax=Paenibacillus aurantiacus TaxID=1936118 RepID=A0ABV5KNQ9_9BACL
MSNLYDFQATTIKGESRSLADFKGNVVVVVNTASKCGLTPQYEGLQELYETYKDQGLEIIGFPSNQFNGQEPGTNEEVETFCKVNYGVTFPLFAKTDVRGEEAHPLFQYLTEAAPYSGSPDEPADNSVKWNFTKFLVDREGNVVERFEPSIVPASMKASIEKLL